MIEALLYAAPALLLLGLLAVGRYPGERLLASVGRTLHARVFSRPPLPILAIAVPRSSPRGGVLLALALAGRGPPAEHAPQARNLRRKEAMKLKSTIALLALFALAIPASAGAHVTLQPEEAPAGDYVVLDVRVPNERDDAATTKIDVQLPPGFAFASYQPVPGWSVRVAMEKLAKPLSSHGEEITEQVSQMTWTAASDQAGVQPGQFQDFPVSVQIPGNPGDTLTFKALQTYDNGEVVRWIGGPEAEQPAPRVAVIEGTEEHGSAAADSDSAESDDSEGASKGLGLAALVLGALGLLAGGAALARSRQAV
jgi:uncharacterized protein